MGQPQLDNTVVMCAEAVPWRCHRSLISDAVLARNGVVEDILCIPTAARRANAHSLTDRSPGWKMGRYSIRQTSNR